MNVVPEGLLTANDLGPFAWRAFFKFLKVLQYFIASEARFFAGKFFGRIWLVKNVILLCAKPHAANAVVTAFQVITIGAVAAIFTVLQSNRVVAILAVQALITERAVEGVIAVHAVGVIIKITPIHAVLILDRIRDEVAVFAVIGIVGVLAVDGVRRMEPMRGVFA